jgi:8-oxo-dGTP pyrophosphatase MutT (NUDIX family)
MYTRIERLELPSGAGVGVNMGLVAQILRPLARAVHRLVKRRPCPSGAHAVALTPERRIILVKLRYAGGWRLPGGGRDADEPVEEAALRELREEIGMTAYARLRRSTVPGVVIVEGVTYRPRRWSWEVERVCEASLTDLPANLSPVAAGWIRRVKREL